MLRELTWNSHSYYKVFKIKISLWSWTLYRYNRAELRFSGLRRLEELQVLLSPSVFSQNFLYLFPIVMRSLFLYINNSICEKKTFTRNIRSLENFVFWKFFRLRTVWATKLNLAHVQLINTNFSSLAIQQVSASHITNRVFRVFRLWRLRLQNPFFAI